MTKSSQSSSSRGKVRAKATTHLGVSVERWQGRVYCKSPRLCAMPFSKRTGRLGTSLITPLPCREMHGVRLVEDPEGRNRRIEMVKRHPNFRSQRRPPNAPTRESVAPGGRKERTARRGGHGKELPDSPDFGLSKGFGSQGCGFRVLSVLCTLFININGHQ